MQMTATPVRVFFEKIGRVKYISHLDTMRAFTRALGRSGLPFWYTQGFNPHLYLTFALPLALGYESVCESFDSRFTDEMDFTDAVKKINAALPPGFRATKIAAPVMDATAIALADYEIRLIYKEADIQKLSSAFETFSSHGPIEVEKKGKKGIRIIDIAPHVTILESEFGDEQADLRLRMAAGSILNINPTIYLQAFYKWSDAMPDGVKVVRTAILTADGKAFE